MEWSLVSRSKLRGYRILFLTVLSSVSTVSALNCIQCSQAYFHGEPGLDDCYKLESFVILNETNCVANEPDSYCFTKIELSDGILSYLERGCTNPRDDPLRASNDFPDSVKCSTSYSTSKGSSNIQQTECYMPCKGDVCNDLRILDSMKSCPEPCPMNSECNYLTGKCQCTANQHETDCSPNAAIAFAGRNCVQCNSKTNSGCANKTNGSRCQNGETHCSTTQTWILKKDGTSDSDPVVTRSCTGQYMSPDRCYLTPASDVEVAEYTEYTCVSTCSTDNCNIGIANGVIDKEFIPTKCVVCEGDEFSCGPARKFMTDCPQNSTYCMSTVTYWETVVNDSVLKGRLKPDPSVSMRSIKRECTSRPVASQCTKTRIGLLNLYETTCQETCTGDGCNSGWPARPKCARCDNTLANSVSTHDCLFNSPPPDDCAGPHHEYCFTHFRNRTQSIGQTGAKYTIVRGCSTYNEDLPAKCRTINEYGRAVGTECSEYCDKDGCNFRDFGVKFGREPTGCKNEAFTIKFPHAMLVWLPLVVNI